VIKLSLVFYFLLLNSFSSPLWASAFDTGTGADGACTEATLVSGKRTYNCTSLTISAAGDSDFFAQAGTLVTIKVEGSVTINGTFNIGGANGGNGSVADPINGGTGGPGASAGGTCNQGANACGTVAGDNNGLGLGAGLGARAGTNNGFAGDGSGGGGGGGSFGALGSAGASGVTNNAGSAGAAGSVGSLYASQSTWETSFVGGSGGGSGGLGQESAGTTHRAGSGGGGGGAIRIMAAGDITINGTLSSPGGNGGEGQIGTTPNQSDDGGCGGGGSGGAIWLQSAGNIINAGTLSAPEGTGGTCAAANNQGGAGGDGGSGRIRLDDSDGVISNVGTISPAALVTTLVIPSGTTALKREYEGDLSCGLVDFSDSSAPPSGPFQLVLTIFLFLSLSRFFKGLKQDSN